MPKWIELEKFKEISKPFIKEDTEGAEFIKAIMENVIETDEPSTASFEDAVKKEREKWDAEQKKKDEEREAENAKKWHEAFFSGVTKEENPDAVAQSATEIKTEEETVNYWQDYSKEGVVGNALYT